MIVLSISRLNCGALVTLTLRLGCMLIVLFPESVSVAESVNVPTTAVAKGKYTDFENRTDSPPSFSTVVASWEIEVHETGLLKFSGTSVPAA